MMTAGTGTGQEQQQPADSQSVSTPEDIRQTLDLLSIVVDNSEDAIYAQDAKGRYLLFNQAACRFMGKTRTEVLGNNDHALFPAAQADMLDATNRRIMATGKPETIEGRFQVAGGERRFAVAKRPLRDHDGRIIGTFGIARDITEQKQAEERLAIWAEAFQRADFAVAIGDPISQAIIVVNPAFARERGYSPEELEGRSIASLFPADQLGGLKRIIAETDAFGHGVFESEHLRKNGERFPVMLDVTVSRSADGRPLFRIAYAIDISARKAAEAALRERNEELERFNRATVGRELDMVALKREVNALARELGRPPPYDLGAIEAASGKDPP